MLSYRSFFILVPANYVLVSSLHTSRAATVRVLLVLLLLFVFRFSPIFRSPVGVLEEIEGIRIRTDDKRNKKRNTKPLHRSVVWSNFRIASGFCFLPVCACLVRVVPLCLLPDPCRLCLHRITYVKAFVLSFHTRACYLVVFVFSFILHEGCFARKKRRKKLSAGPFQAKVRTKD